MSFMGLCLTVSVRGDRRGPGPGGPVEPDERERRGEYRAGGDGERGEHAGRVPDHADQQRADDLPDLPGDRAQREAARDRLELFALLDEQRHARGQPEGVAPQIP